MRVSRDKGLGVCTVACAVASLLPMTATAQESGQEAAQAGGLQEIVVTARRRDESLQDLPVSVQALTAEDIELRGLDSGRDITATVPNVVLGGGGAGDASAVMVVRGMPGVGVYLDGVWQGNEGALQTNLVEMQRVEVLRGPQGTLFGRNTNGGAIQYVTRLPGEEFGARFDLTVGEFARRDVTASVDLPIHSTLLTKFTAASLERDGYVQNVAGGPDYGHQDDKMLRADVLWRPLEAFQARLTATLSDQNTSNTHQMRFTNLNHRVVLAYNIVASNPAFGLPIRSWTPQTHEVGYPGGEVDEWETKSMQDENGIQHDIDSYTLTLDWNLSETMHLKSISAYRERYSRGISDWDASEIVMTTDDRNWNNRMFSQELHFSGSLFQDRLSYLLGGYYSDTFDRFRFYRWTMHEFFVPSASAPNGRAPNMQLVNYVRAWGVANNNAAARNFSPTNISNDTLEYTEEKDKALFSEVSYNLTDALELTAGLRWSWDDGKFQTLRPTDALQLWNPPEYGGGHGPGNMWVGNVLTTEERGGTGSIFTPKFSARYRWTPELMTYVSYAEGYTRGQVVFVQHLNGLNQGGTVSLDPEVVSTYEIGVRSDWFGNTLRVNGNYFRNRWEGLRVPILPRDPATGEPLPFPYNTSDGEAKAQGIELEAQWSPSDALQFNLAAGWLDTEYTEVGDPSVSSLRIGAPFQYAPRYTASVGAQYNLSLGNGARVTFRGDYGWLDEYQRSAAAQQQTLRPEPAYGLLNARVRYMAPDANWSLSLFGTNLTDEHYVSGGYNLIQPWGTDILTIGRPREVGLTLQFTFD